MNKAEREVAKKTLSDEKKMMSDIKKVYEEARKQTRANIEALASRSDLQNAGSIVYQMKYQIAIDKQIGSILEKLEKNQYATVEAYLKDSYNNGFVGSMYSLKSNGIPLAVPINQKQVVKAIQNNSKLSVPLYTKLGEDIGKLKGDIKQYVSRSIISGKSWSDIADGLAGGMNSPFEKAYNLTTRIARTEGHRIQEQATFDAMLEAKNAGADVVKQWDATLDDRTREEHAEADGQIREIDEPFDVGGEQIMMAGDGSAENCINCRCHVLIRPRWALDEAELAELQDRAEFFGLDKTKDFNEYMTKYLNLPEGVNLPTRIVDITEGGKYERIKAKTADAFAKAIEHDFTTQRISVKELNQLWSKNGGYIQNSSGYKMINNYLRGITSKIGNPKASMTERILNRVTRNNALKKDLIGIRKVNMEYLKDVLGINIDGLVKDAQRKTAQGGSRLVSAPKDKASAQKLVDEINRLVGTPEGTILDKAYTSISLSEDLNFFKHFPVEFELQLPKGTKGLITNNLMESEFITQKGSSIEIIGAKVYNKRNKEVCIKIFGKVVQ